MLQLKKKKNVIKVLKFTESQLIIMQNWTNVYPHVKPIILTQLIMGFFFFLIRLIMGLKLELCTIV